MSKPILVLDFDGVMHSYESGWKGATEIPDPPVKGMVKFLRSAIDVFDVQVLSSRSKEPGGIEAMQRWLRQHVQDHYDCAFHTGAQRDFDNANQVLDSVKFVTEKPAAFVTLDDRAVTFMGVWPDVDWLRGFRPWNKA